MSAGLGQDQESSPVRTASFRLGSQRLGLEINTWSTGFNSDSVVKGPVKSF